MGELKKFLGDFRRSRAREYLLTSRLVHDLGVAAADAGYDLSVYLPAVDADGFDVILDDQDRLVPIQLKSVVSTGKVAEWAIHRSLLRPDVSDVELYGFEPSPTGTGRGGGVLLTKVAASGAKVDVTYLYTDVAVLSAFWLDVLRLPSPQKQRLDRLRRELEGSPSGTVKVPRSAFLTAKDPDHLLAIMGLYSQVKTSWRYLLHDLLRYEYLRLYLGDKALRTDSDPGKVRKSLEEDLRRLLN